jgi:hypothetical protein
MTSYRWYECDNNNISDEKTTLIQCSETIGYSSGIFTFLLFLFPFCGLLTNGFLIFAFLSKKKRTRKL